MTVQQHEFLRQFARNTLGCECPDAVFDNIRVSGGPDGERARTIDIGGRLLIHILAVTGNREIAETVTPALERGVAERNRGGFNRFRLVLAADDPDRVRAAAEQAFAASACRDDRTHLHVLAREQVAALCE